MLDYVTLSICTVFMYKTTTVWYHFFLLFLLYFLYLSFYHLSPSPELRERNPGYSWTQHYTQKQNSSFDFCTFYNYCFTKLVFFPFNIFHFGVLKIKYDILKHLNNTFPRMILSVGLGNPTARGPTDNITGCL